MKLASLPDGSPDGRLVVVSRDLTVCSDARHIAPSLAAALAGWEAAAPELDLIARGVEALGQPLERFHERAACAPLPVAGGRCASTHPRSAIRTGADAAITAEIGFAPSSATGPSAALRPRRRPRRRAARTLSPAAVTEDEVGHGTLSVRVTGQAPGPDRRAASCRPHLPDAAAARVRRLAPVAVLTLHPGDTLRVEYRDRAGHSVFGAIERTVAAAAPAEALAEGG